MSFSVPSYIRDSYTMLCVCPTRLEFAAMEGALDEVHPNIATTGRDKNAYTLGQIGRHNIAVTVLPEAGHGMAGAVVMQALNDFKSIRFGFLVNVGGGIPSGDEYDIRLGDVVVATPLGTSSGVVPFARGRVQANGDFEQTKMINKPPQVLLEYVHRLQSKHLREGHKIDQIVRGMLGKFHIMRDERFENPGADQDLYFQNAYEHNGARGCATCDRTRLVARLPRAAAPLRVHYGKIGSSNTVINSAAIRQTLHQQLGVICVETEATGMMDEFPCLVICGVGDYLDSHKNSQWHPYAAATAAAYLKELLSVIPPSNNNGDRFLNSDVKKGLRHGEKELHTRTFHSLST
ncbi:nucleoside phosphorylase domain-containing protein [Aspergillus avenaceus]|uniref:Nucleoside phosphorylase domain-containing protein n=1 Tax=Aspergillus avenaceus TaxID=36643 RepID=A0A5N6U2K2_ASPAV|nr:nucleoside phosphorylase domain-containing protein [Aspergillus avenaceus]